MNFRLGAGVIAIATHFVLTACALNSPGSVKDCVAQAIDSEHVRFEASIQIKGRMSAKKVYVLLSTSGRISGRGADTGGSLVEYELNGPFPPGEWIHTTALKDVEADPFTLNQHLGNNVDCYVHSIVFSDGSHWEGPSPM
jgi:hypothetical protein